MQIGTHVILVTFLTIFISEIQKNCWKILTIYSDPLLLVVFLDHVNKNIC
jgi:hypothetical protein